MRGPTGSERREGTTSRVRRATARSRDRVPWLSRLPRPRRDDAAVVVRVGLAMPGVLLRAALAATVLGLGVVLSPSTAGVVVGGSAAALLAVVPGSGAAAVVVLGVGGSVLVADPPSTWVLAGLVLLVHVVLVLVALAAQVPVRARVELEVVGRQLWAAAPVQLGVQVLALVAGALGGVLAGTGLALEDTVRVLALLAVAGVGLVVLRPDPRTHGPGG